MIINYYLALLFCLLISHLYISFYVSVDKRIKQFLSAIIFVQGFSIIFTHNKVAVAIGILLIVVSLISYSKNIGKDHKNHNRKTLSSYLINKIAKDDIRYYLFPIVGFLLISLDIIYSRLILKNNLGWNDTLVILLGLNLVLYGAFPSKFSFESDFLIFFLFFSNLLLVFPSIVFDILLQNTSSENFWQDNFVPKFLVIPLSKMLALTGVDNYYINSEITLRDIEDQYYKIHIAYMCSGIQSVGIFIAAFISYILSIYNKIDIYFLKVLILGIIFSYVANLLRMYIVIMSGYLWGSEVLHYVHENLGWIIFTFWIGLFWFILNRYENIESLDG